MNGCPENKKLGNDPRSSTSACRERFVNQSGLGPLEGTVSLCENLLHHIAKNIREPEIAAGVTVGERFMVEAE